MSPAYILMGIRQREEKYLCDQATSGQSQTLIHVLAIRVLITIYSLVTAAHSSVKSFICKAFVCSN